MNCMYAHPSLMVFALALALATPIANAQVPSSAFGAPSSSLHGGSSINQPAPGGAPIAPAWTPRNAAPAAALAAQSNAVQQANLPADLAKLSDGASIMIGGKPMTAGEVKRAVLALDDKAIITIGGRQTAAAAMKREIAGAQAAIAG